MNKNGMTLNKKRWYRKSRVLLILAGALLVILAAGYFVYQIMTRRDTSTTSPPNTINYDSPTDEQKNAGTSAKEELLNKDSESQSTPPSANGKNRVVITITKAEQSGDGTLHVSAILQTLESGGTCALKLTRKSDGAVVNKTSIVIKQSSYSACADFDVPKSEIPAGNWQLTVSYSSPKSEGTSSQDMVVN